MIKISAFSCVMHSEWKCRFDTCSRIVYGGILAKIVQKQRLLSLMFRHLTENVQTTLYG